MQIFHACVEVFVHFDFVAVKFEFGRVEKRFAACKARDYGVHAFDKVDYRNHRAVRHCRSYIARNRVRKGWANVRVVEFVLPCALAVEYIAVALNENIARAQHIRKFADFFRILDR